MHSWQLCPTALELNAINHKNSDITIDGILSGSNRALRYHIWPIQKSTVTGAFDTVRMPLSSLLTVSKWDKRVTCSANRHNCCQIERTTWPGFRVIIIISPQVCLGMKWLIQGVIMKWSQGICKASGNHFILCLGTILYYPAFGILYVTLWYPYD